MPLPCLSILCRRPAGRFAAMRHCDAVFAPPQLCKSAPRPCVAIHCATMPLLRHATPQHCRSIHGQSGVAPIVAHAAHSIAPAAPCQSSPTPCQSMPNAAKPSPCQSMLRHHIAKPRPCVASPCHRTALLCHRVAPNAAQFLAIALQVRATQRLCQAWQSLLCPCLTSLRRRFATRTSHCLCAAHLALPPPY